MNFFFFFDFLNFLLSNCSQCYIWRNLSTKSTGHFLASCQSILTGFLVSCSSCGLCIVEPDMHFICFDKYIWRVHLHIQMKSNKSRGLNTLHMLFMDSANYCIAFRPDRYLSGTNREIPPHSKKHPLQIFSPTMSGMRVCHFCCLLYGKS